MKRLVPFVLAALMATPASAFIATNGMVVERTGPTEFFVPYRGQSAPQAFWCAAGQYAWQELGMNTGRIWRLSPPRRRSGEGILFSLRPEGAARNTGLLLIGGDRGSLSVTLARKLCERPEDRR